ncbi:hypothetical protein PMSD_20440 [Paenibacillus macquariensis subsp. defensor]|nr:hypothetical protein PMSD_20440 [Paenibacillus macquariensis subsp. defensor]
MYSHPVKQKKWYSLALTIILFVTTLLPTSLMANVPMVAAASTVGSKGFKAGDVVFSQMYVNGGNKGAFYNTKFFELYNNTDRDIDLSGWSIANSAVGTMSFAAGKALKGTIKAHSYFLITGATGTAGGVDLPVKTDFDSGLNPNGSTGGAVVLAQTTAAIGSNPDNADIVDLFAFSNATTTVFKNPMYWGKPFIADNVGSGTILRKTNVGSDPRANVGLGNGWLTKDTSVDFVMNAPANTSKPDEVSVRNSAYMTSPDATKISFNKGTGSLTGVANAVPAFSSVAVYAENNGVVSKLGTAAATVDGSFSVNGLNTGSNSSIFVTHTDTAQTSPKESVYTRINDIGYAKGVEKISDLRTNDGNGLPLNIGYDTTIEGVVTADNKSLGKEKMNIMLQDATGGIQVIGNQDLAEQIQIGNKIRVDGCVVFTAGTTQFLPTSVSDLGQGNEITAEKINFSSLASYGNAEPLEGKLVTFKGKVTNIPATGPDYNVTVADDAGNAIIVRILATSGIDVSNGDMTLNDSYTFTGVVGQSKLTSPFTSGYYVLPRKLADVKGELQLQHTPLEKAYKGIDVSFTVMAKNADSVTLYYNGADHSPYQSLLMETADHQNYNVKIPQQQVKDKLSYYIEAVGGGDTVSQGKADAPITINVVEDQDGPQYFDATPADGDSIESKHPVISVSLKDPSGVDTSTIQLSLDDVDVTSKATVTETEVSLALTSVDDLSEGIHHVVVKSKDKLGNPSTGSWSFEVVKRFIGGNHYRGTTHNHTIISHDGAGSPAEALKAALAHNYDFFAFSDHSHDIDSKLVGTDSVERKGMKERAGGADWQLTKDLAKQYTKDDQFVVFPAFEMTSTTWGHSNVFGTDNFIDRVEEGGTYQKLQNYYAWVMTYDNVVAQFNHPEMSKNAFDNFIPYDKNVDKLFTMLEVGNGSGKYSYVNVENMFFKALDLGWHVAPTYGEDNHDATWGQTKKRTVIVSEDLSQESLLESMRKMRVYFSEDPNATLDFSANGYYMGSTTDTKSLQFDISGSDAVSESSSDPAYSFIKNPSNDNVEKVELITNGGKVLDTFVPKTDSTSFHWQPKYTVTGGQQWFVVRVTQKDGDRTYSSPIWSPVEPLSVSVSNVDAVDGAIVGGVPANLKATISNLGTLGVNKLTAHFYYDSQDEQHFIGDATIDSLNSNQSAAANVIWNNPVDGDHKIIVVLEAGDGHDLGSNKYEQSFAIKAPLGKTIMIEATHNNENTITDTGTYKDNLKSFTVKMRQQGYTVVQNSTGISSQSLSSVDVLMITHPASSYNSSEITAIKQFVQGGGSLLLTEKSNFGGSNQNSNDILSNIGSSIMVNNDGVFDETAYGNFWPNPLSSNFSVRLHPKPINQLTDFVPTIEYYSGASLAKNDGTGKKVPLLEGGGATILVRGNESTFQGSTSVKSDTVTYNVKTSNGTSGPALSDVTGGLSIPMIASEEIASGRVVVSGMNIFNDNQLKPSNDAKGNDPFALNVINWLSHREPKVVSLEEARKLPEETEVVVQGQVTTAAGVFYDAFYMQDETGGIMAFSEVPEGSLKVGDTVRAYGHIKVFENNTELEFDKFNNSIVKISSGLPVLPKAVRTQEANDEQNQGLLVKVVGTVEEVPDNNSYVINDGSGKILVYTDGYIINQSGVPIPKLNVGDKLSAIGLASKFTEGNRIRVRDSRELFNADTLVPVTDITIDNSSLTLNVGGSSELKATITPSNATNKAVIWSSSDESIASVADGIVVGVKPGKAKVTATAMDGNYKAEASVQVMAAVPAAPNVTADNVNRKIIGINETMEYNMDNTNWTAYAADKPPIMNGDHTIQVRVKAGDNSPAGEITTIHFGTLVPVLTGFTWAKGSKVGTQAVTAPEGTLKYVIGAGGFQSAPIVGSVATAYTHQLRMNEDIAVASGQHIYIVSVDQADQIIGWADITVSADQIIPPTTLAGWNFDADSNIATSGITENLDKKVTLVGAAATSYATGSGPSGKAGKAIASSDWTMDPAYWEASVTTTGFTNIQVSSLQYGSGTGPKDFKVEYSLDEKLWSPIPNSNIAVASNWTSGKLVNLSLPAKADNQSVVYIRWIKASLMSVNNAAIASGGTDRIDEISMTGIPSDIQQPPVQVTGITLDQMKVDIKVGETAQLTASITPVDAANKDVTWASSDETVAQVSDTGTIAAIAEGIAQIIVTTVDGAFKVTATVNVTAADTGGGNPVLVTGITLDQTKVDLKIGETAQLTATIAPADAANKDVTWATNDETFVQVSDTGMITAIAEGTAQITVTTVDGAFKATANVNVTAADTGGGNPVLVTGITLDQTKVDLKVGETAQLTASITPVDAANKDVTWATNDETVAQVSDTGMITPIAAGTAVITVTTVDGGFTATAEVTVTNDEPGGIDPVQVTGVALNTTSLDMKKGSSYQFKANIAPADASNTEVRWTSSNVDVVIVDTTGIVMAVGVGNTTITATTTDGGFTATASVTVTREPETGDSNGGGSVSPGPSDSGSKDNSSSGSNTGTKPSPGTQLVSVDELLKGNFGGVTTIQMQDQMTNLQLPTNVVALLGQNYLEVKTGTYTLQIPSELLVQLTNKLTAEERKNSVISLVVRPMSDTDAQKIIGSGQNQQTIKISGNVYEFILLVSSTNGKTQELKTFDKPMTLHLKVGSSINPQRAAIYYISDQGQLEYIGGKYSNGEFIAEISHFSKYAVLEVTKLFSDVPTSHWAFNVIQELAQKKIVQGTSETSFEPNRNITRAEFTSILVNALKLSKTSDHRFNDVAGSAWYAEPVSIAYAAGIVKGKNESEFDPQGLIARQEMVSMMVKAYEMMNDKKIVVSNTSSFSDMNQVSPWATEYVNKAVSQGLIQGRSVNTFAPIGLTTRAEAAQAIYNLMK